MNNSKRAGWIARAIVSPLHRSTVAGRRVRQIAKHLADLLPEGRSLTGLDVGCGAGELAVELQTRVPGVTLSGVDVLVRPNPVIPVQAFDGHVLPFAAASFDFVMISDVLHHTDDPVALLQECARVAREFVLVKDHVSDSGLDELILRAMDWVGNRGHGVYLPYNYLSSPGWENALRATQLTESERHTHLSLYPPPLSWLFDRQLHFVSRFDVAAHG